MTVIEMPEGLFKVVSAPDGKLPAPDPLSEALVGLEDGRLFVRDDFLGRAEIDLYAKLFSDSTRTSGRVTWVKKDLFRNLLSRMRSAPDRPETPCSSPDLPENRQTGEVEAPLFPEELSSGDSRTEIPKSLSENAIRLPDGRIAATEDLRGDPEFDRFVRQYSVEMEAKGKIGHFRVLWVDDRTLRTFRGEETPVVLPEEEDPEPVPVPEEPPAGDSMEEAPVVPAFSSHFSGPLADTHPLSPVQETDPGTEKPGEHRESVKATDPDPECLSSPSGGTIPDFRAPDDIASMVFLDLSGRFYVSREHRTNQHVNYYYRHFVPELWPKIFGGRPLPKPQFVSYEALRKIRRECLPEEAAREGYRAEGDEARKIMEIIREGITRKASDIHLRVERDRTRILYRVHGWLKPVQTLTHEEGERLARIIYNTMLDSAGRDNMFSDKKPQDGQFRQDYLPPGVFNIREFHAPTLGAGLGTITMVLRLQYGSDTAGDHVTDIETLGYDGVHLAQLRFLTGLSHGIVLFAGPMGSGKSTSMAAILSIVLSMHPLEEGRGLHLATLEDPPEYVIPTASQIAVPGGLFSEVLGRIMRFDANILMIGEIRDEATAEKAIEGAMSGHVVYSTVHANDVLSIPRRLDGLKVRRDLLVDPTIFRGMICQRLVPLVCMDCRMSAPEAREKGLLSNDLSRRIEECETDPERVFFQRPGGCGTCDHQGIVGRTIVAEILLPDQEILDRIAGSRMTDAWRYFRETLSGRTMMDHAIEKIRAGLVDPRDVEARLGWIHKGFLDHRTVREIVGSFS